MSLDSEANIDIDKLVSATAAAIESVATTLPNFDSVQEVIRSTSEATNRGYFLPDEDELVRDMFARYLSSRAALTESLEELRPHALTELSLPEPKRPEVFVLAYCIACLLMRSGRFLADNFRKEKVIWKKLDEPEPRFGIPKKQFTAIYRSVTSPRNIWVFLEATRYWRQNKDELVARFEKDKTIRPVLNLLLEEEPWIETSKSYYAKHRLKYRLHSFLRRQHSGFKNVTFALFEVGGRLVAEMRMKWKRKRVTPGVQRKLARILRPGDVLITRHDDAASNLFLPGFWPHGALYIGTNEQRQQLKIQPPSELIGEKSVDPVCVLEARKDGVLFRELSDTLSVDACTVIRPKLNPEQIREAIERAMTHEGKQYDFEFDFRRSNRLVCTEVIYRAYHGCDPIHFELSMRKGRVCLSAEDLLDSAVEGDFFDVIAIYGIDGNRFAENERAKELLIKSYRD